MLCVIWSDLAGRVAGLVRAYPALAPRLMYAPRRAVHAYAIALHEAAVDDSAGAEAALAARLADTHPRCSARLYGLLDRCGETVRPRAFYQRLHALLLSDLAPILLEATSIEDHVLDFAESVGAMDRLVVRARRALDHSVTRAHAFQDLLDLLGDHGIAAANLADSLSERGGRKALAGFVRRQFDRLAMPQPDFPAPAGLRFLTTIGDVRAAGREHTNCLTGFAGRYDTAWTSFATGTRIYLARDDPPLVLSMCRGGRRMWWIEQTAGSSNASLPAEVRERIERDLVAAGVQLLRGDPHRSLWALLDPPKAARDGGGDEDDEVDDDVDLAA